MMPSTKEAKRLSPKDIAAPFGATITRTVALSGLSRSEIYRRLADGKLRAVKCGRTTIILWGSVTEYLASLPVATFRKPTSPDSAAGAIDDLPCNGGMADAPLRPHEEGGT